ncbi:DUF2798 domain-containing protein [Vibrio sp. HI00D65]|uniref:DUF2798 domain-containing protein n=1 Tax=Vibrio sp. HI00D65 TaxID=1822216 RepID=UPI0009EDEB59|nr:DUF2798 domain-containing protein [Vibrio sp. HI00D65]
MKRRVLFSTIMSFFLSSLMTLWVTYLNIGSSPVFFKLWVNAFLLAWPAAGIISFFFSPFAQKITNKVLKN